MARSHGLDQKARPVSRSSASRNMSMVIVPIAHGATPSCQAPSSPTRSRTVSVSAAARSSQRATSGASPPSTREATPSPATGMIRSWCQ